MGRAVRSPYDDSKPWLEQRREDTAAAAEGGGGITNDAPVNTIPVTDADGNLTGSAQALQWDDSDKTLTLTTEQEDSTIQTEGLGSAIFLRGGAGDANNDGGIAWVLGGTGPAGSAGGHVIIQGGNGGSQTGARIDIDAGKDYGSANAGDAFIRGGASEDNTRRGGHVSISSGAGNPAGYIELSSASGIVHLSAVLRLTPLAFESLPASPTEGMVASIEDSNTVTWGANIAGGGANKVLGYYNGTNWTVFAK